jgi:hypothetical protein
MKSLKRIFCQVISLFFILSGVLYNQCLYAQATPLPELSLKSGKAVFKCRFTDYDPNVVSRLTFVWKNIFELIPQPISCDIDENGYAEVNIELYAPTMVELHSDFIGGYIMLTPGEESSLEVNMKDVIAHRATLKEGEPETMDNFIFSGANADLNKQLSSDEVAEFLFTDWKNIIDLVRGFLGMSLDDYKDFHIKSGAEKLAKLDSLKGAMNLSEQLYEMVKLRIHYQVLESLLQPDVFLASTIKIAQSDGKATDYKVPPINADYFNFLKDYPINSKVSLYAPEYKNILLHCRYVSLKLRMEDKQPFRDTYFFEHLEKSGELMAEDAPLVKEMMKMNYFAWNKKQINEYKKSNLKIIQTIMALKEKELSIELKQQATKIINDIKQIKDAKDVVLVDRSLFSFNNDLVDNYVATRAFIDEILDKNAPAGITPQADEETQNKFNERYADQRNRFVNNWIADGNKRYLARIFGTDKGFLFDVLYLNHLTDQIDKGMLINKDDVDKLSTMEPFYWEYITTRKNRIRQ